MNKVRLFSCLLAAGLIVSQVAPRLVGTDYGQAASPMRLVTMAALAFIMIDVGVGFKIDRNKPLYYVYDYWVAMVAAALPWLLCCLYLVYAMSPSAQWSNVDHWENMLILSRFAAPTSAGILFSMLSAAGLSNTWVYKKAQNLAIFDDVDTILFVILLQMIKIGFAWQLAIVGVFVIALLYVAWHYLHSVRIPHSWPWRLGYAILLAWICDSIYRFSMTIDPNVPLRIEVLLPAFVLGCVIAPAAETSQAGPSTKRLLGDEAAVTAITAIFMFLAGASLPVIGGEAGKSVNAASNLDDYGAATIVANVLALTLLGNIGKMYPALCYRNEASLFERVALGVCMFPRGEVGTGVLVISLSYGIQGAIVTAATLSLALNLVGTGWFISIINRLLKLAAVRPAPRV
jgi:Kef-type K+ transport system membrane component KefB